MLFICEDNSALSPMAEAIFRSLFPQHEVQSAGRYSAHVRRPIRSVLRALEIDDSGLLSKDMLAVDMQEVTEVIGLGLPDSSFPIPSRFEINWWVLPDPACAPAAEIEDAYSATRDELVRRISALGRERGWYPARNIEL